MNLKQLIHQILDTSVNRDEHGHIITPEVQIEVDGVLCDISCIKEVDDKLLVINTKKVIDNAD